MSDFPLSASIPFVLDTSVAINFNATKHAAAVIRAFPNPFAVTDTVFRELEEGEKWGHRDAGQFHPLITGGLVEKADLSQKGRDIFEALVGGDTGRSLQDGEASTIAYAIEVSGIAVLDERIARRTCSEHYPGLPVARTIELFLHRIILEALGPEAQIDIVFQAIRNKRMHVGPDYLKQVVELIGEERAALCSSLPRIFRQRT